MYEGGRSHDPKLQLYQQQLYSWILKKPMTQHDDIKKDLIWGIGCEDGRWVEGTQDHDQ